MTIIASRRIGKRVRPIVRRLMEYYAHRVLQQPLHWEAYLEDDQAQALDRLVHAFQRQYRLRKRLQARKKSE